MGTKVGYKGKVIQLPGIVHAPYIPQFILKKKKTLMLLRLRKRFLNWLRETDEYDRYGNPIQEAVKEEELPKKRKGSWASLFGTTSNRSNGNLAIRGASTRQSVSHDEPEIQSRGMIFKLFPARGGIVIETYYYDDKADQDRNTLHLISESEDLSEALAKIISLEAMRNQ